MRPSVVKTRPAAESKIQEENKSVADANISEEDNEQE